MQKTYFLLILNTAEMYDYATSYVNYKPVDYGLAFSYYPLDDFFTFDSKYFCSERLFYEVFGGHKCHVLSYEVKKISDKIRVEKNGNWLANYPEAEIPTYFEIDFLGTPFKDDLGKTMLTVEHPVVGAYNREYLIISKGLAETLLINHCPAILGVKIEKNQLDQLSIMEEEIRNRPNDFLLINQIDKFNVF